MECIQVLAREGYDDLHPSCFCLACSLVIAHNGAYRLRTMANLEVYATGIKNHRGSINHMPPAAGVVII
jgi:hypothetical protein